MANVLEARHAADTVEFTHNYIRMDGQFASLTSLCKPNAIKYGKINDISKQYCRVYPFYVEQVSRINENVYFH